MAVANTRRTFPVLLSFCYFPRPVPGLATYAQGILRVGPAYSPEGYCIQQETQTRISPVRKAALVK